MPVIVNQILSLEKDVFPVLAAAGLSPMWKGGYTGSHEGIVTSLGYVTQCNKNDLFIEGHKQLADLLVEKCRPFGSELIAHFYPKNISYASRQRSWLERFLSPEVD